jgi:hypothetical protein
MKPSRPALLTSVIMILASGLALAAQPNPHLIDKSIFKGHELESLVTTKIDQIFSTYIADKDKYRFNVNISVARASYDPAIAAAAAEAAEKKAEKEKARAQAMPDLPALSGSVFDLQKIIDAYADDLAQNNQDNDQPNINVIMQSGASTVDRNAWYEVSGTVVTAVVDTTVPTEVFEKAKTAVNDALKAVFSTRLTFNITQEQLTKKPVFWERASRFQLVVTALIAFLAAIALILIGKLVPSRQVSQAQKIEIETQQRAAQARIATTAKKEAEPKGDAKGKKETEGGTLNAFDILFLEIQDLEKQIGSVGQMRPGVPKLLMEEWSGTEEGLLNIAVMLETLAKFSVGIERFEVKKDVLKSMRALKNKLIEMKPDKKAAILKDVYWALVSYSFISEEQLGSQFKFLETVNDAGIAELICEEPIDIQAMVLLGLHESRSSKVMARLPDATKPELLSKICTGPDLKEKEIKKAAERLRTAANKMMAERNCKAGDEDGGVGALIPMLKSMDFKTRFQTARGLLYLETETKERLRSKFFNVAFLPELRLERLAALFGRHDAQWIHTILSQYDQAFYDKVIGILSDSVKSKLEEMKQVPVVPSAAYAVLESLDREICADVEAGRMTLADEYDRTSSETSVEVGDVEQAAA